MPSDILVVPIAAAGNYGNRYPFAPAYWPDVLSVSAEYSDLVNRCTPPLATPSGLTITVLEQAGLLDDIANQIVQLEHVSDTINFEARSQNAVEGFLTAHSMLPPSNDGEVRMNGVAAVFPDADQTFGCLWGTSFAAPRLSYETAIFLTDFTPPADCHNTNSALALAYDEWRNYPREVAARIYCNNFNVSVNGFFNNLGMMSADEIRIP